MERFLKDFFATADEEELAEFEAELESIIKSCPDGDEAIIDSVNEQAAAEGEPIKASAPLKKKTVLPAVIAAVLTVALFVGIFSRLSPPQKSQPAAPATSQTADAPESSESSSFDEAEYQREMNAVKVHDFFDACCQAVLNGQLDFKELPLRGFSADLDNPNHSGTKRLNELRTKLEHCYSKEVTVDGETFSVDSVRPQLPDSGELYVYITPDFIVAVTQWREDEGELQGTICADAYGVKLETKGFGEVRFPDVKPSNSASAMCYEQDAVPIENSSSPAAEILKSTIPETGGIYVFDDPKRVYDPIGESRLSLMIGGFKKYTSTPIIEFYLIAETADGLPIIPTDHINWLEDKINVKLFLNNKGNASVESDSLCRWNPIGSDPTVLVYALSFPLPEGMSFEDIRNDLFSLTIGNFTDGDSVYYYSDMTLSLVMDSEESPEPCSCKLSRIMGDGTVLESIDLKDPELSEELAVWLEDIVNRPAGVCYDLHPKPYSDMDPDTEYLTADFGDGLRIIASAEIDEAEDMNITNQVIVNAGATIYIADHESGQDKEMADVLNKCFEKNE